MIPHRVKLHCKNPKMYRKYIIRSTNFYFPHSTNSLIICKTGNYNTRYYTHLTTCTCRLTYGVTTHVQLPQRSLDYLGSFQLVVDQTLSQVDLFTGCLVRVGVGLGALRPRVLQYVFGSGAF